eukprot:g5304.t1
MLIRSQLQHLTEKHGASANGGGKEIPATSAIDSNDLQGAGARHRVQQIWAEHAGGQRRNDVKVQKDPNKKTASIFNVLGDLFRENQLNPEHEASTIRLVEAWPFLTRESRRLAAETSSKVLSLSLPKMKRKRARRGVLPGCASGLPWQCWQGLDNRRQPAQAPE